MTMTVDVGSDLNASFMDLQALKPTTTRGTTGTGASISTGNPSFGPSVEKNFHESAHTLATVECSESSWVGDLDASFSSSSPLIRAASPKQRSAGLLKKPSLGLKSLAETPNLDCEQQDGDDDQHDFTSSSTQDDEDASIKEILEAYLTKKSKEEQHEEAPKPSAVCIPARRPKLFRTPTPDPDGLYMEIRRHPRRYRRCTAKQVQAATVLQKAIRNWMSSLTNTDGHETPKVSNNSNNDKDDDNLRFLCRNKSFEGFMGDFLKNATPKRAAPRRDEEDAVEPTRGTLGCSRSFDANDFAQALGESHAPPVRRGGRRPQR